MEVKVIHRMEHSAFAIYVKLSEDREQHVSKFLVDGKLMEVETLSGQEAPVWMMIPEEIFERIVTEGREHFPEKTDHVQEALTDTRAVRDRLLALVEIVVNNS